MYKRVWNSYCALTVLLILFSSHPYAGAAVPGSPAGLTAITGNSEASLTWEAVPGATRYLLYRGTASGGPYSFVAETEGTGYADHEPSNGSTYYYVVTALNADGQSSYSSQVSVTPNATMLPAPTGLTALPGNGEVSLSWEPVTSAVSYNIYRATSRGGPYTLLTPPAPGPSFTDRELTNGTPYFYVVQTMSTKAGAYSDEANATPSALLPFAPAIFTATPGSTWASLSWSVSEGAAAYAVYRGTKIGGPYAFEALPNANTYEDTGLSNGTTYYYVVAAVNANGRGAFSVEASAAVAASAKPHAPVLTARPYDKQVSLSWDGSFGAVSYKVYRRTASGTYDTPLVTTTSSGYYDSAETGLVNGTAYYYVVDAHNASSTVVRSNEVVVTPAVALSAPANIAVIPGNTQATVTWEPVAGAWDYSITIATSPGGPYISGGQAYGKPSFTATDLTNGDTYYIRVQSGGSQWSAFSSEVSTAPAATLPLAPTNLGLTIGNRELSLTWQAVTGATGYKVYRRTEESAWSSSPIGSPTATLFTDTGLANGTKYYYSVAAVNEGGTGAWSGQTSGTPTEVALPAPTNVVVKPGNTQATVTWDPVVGAWEYVVTIATSPGGPYIAGGQAYGKPSFTAIDLTNDETYYFRVQSGGGQWSAFSAEVSTAPAATLPLAPTDLGVTPGNTQLSLTWQAVTGATGYKVYRRTEGSTWSAAPIGSPTATLFTDTGVANGTKYYYSVAAVNAVNTGAWSAETSGTPTGVASSAPTNVAVKPGNTQATVTWDPVAGAGDYSVTIAVSPGGPNISGGQTSGKPSFTATGLTNGQTYYFRVQSTGSQWSAYSAEVSTMPSATLPLAPANLGVTPGNTQLSLTWQAVTGATGYQIYRRTEGSAWSTNPIGSPTATLFTDAGQTNGTKYYYSVAAVNADGTGAWSAETSGTPTAGGTPVPVNIAVTPGNQQATVTWDPAAGATSYYVTVAASPGGLGTSSSGNTTALFFTATGLNNGQTYYFRVQAAGNQISPFSAEVSAIPNPAANIGNISGRVSVNFAGYSGLGVKNATVSLQGTGYTASPDAQGNFTLLNIPFGNYSLVVTAPNMDTVIQDVSLTGSSLPVTIPPMVVSAGSTLKGDANDDKRLNLADVIYLLQMISGERE